MTITFSAQQFHRWKCRSIFIRLAIVTSQTCEVAQNCEKIWTYSISRSSMFDDFGTNWKHICESILVISSNFGPTPILHRFWDTVTYWLKIEYFSYPCLIRRPCSLWSLWNFAVKLTIKKLPESWGYSVVKVAWSTHVTDRLTDRRMDRLMDGRTDGWTDRWTIAYMLSCTKNRKDHQITVVPIY